MGIFIVFVLSRALHPMVIDYSKVDGKMLYSKNSPAIMSRLVREKKQTATEYDIHTVDGWNPAPADR